MFIRCQSKSQRLHNSLQAGSQQSRREVRQGGQPEKGRAHGEDGVLCSAVAVASGRGREVRRDRGLGADEPTGDLPPAPSRPGRLSTPPPPRSRQRPHASHAGHGGLSGTVASRRPRSCSVCSAPPRRPGSGLLSPFLQVLTQVSPSWRGFPGHPS